MKAVHFGAGNIGRGFIGKILADAGIQVTFVDVDRELVDALNKEQSYRVRVVGSAERFETVSGVSAIHSENHSLIDELAHCDLVTTAVGADLLSRIAKPIAEGLGKKIACDDRKPVNVIACENRLCASSELGREVKQHLSDYQIRFVDEVVGFVDSAVDRIVPPLDRERSDPLAVTVESFSEWIVDRTQFRGDIPEIAGMELSDNLIAFVERKLFTLNTGHIITAYLGATKGYSTVGEAVADSTVRDFVRRAMHESGEVLIRRYGFDREQHMAYIDKIIERFANPYLVDEIARVGRQPIRKLDRDDRLVKPLLGTLEYNLDNSALVTGIAAAFHYRSDDDPQSLEIQGKIAQQGIGAAVAHYTGIDRKEPTVGRIVQAFERLRHGI